MNQQQHTEAAEYDNLFGLFKKKNKKKPTDGERKKLRKARWKKFWTDLEANVKQDSTADNIIQIIKTKDDSTNQEDDDYRLTLLEEESAKKEKGIPTIVWVVGGVTVALVGGIFLYTYFKNKKANANTDTGK